jgi:hypothetical protein
MNGRSPLVSVGSRVARILVAAAALAMLAPAAFAAKKPAEIFPEYAQRKASLGHVTLLADVVVVRQEGGTPVVRMARSRDFADSLIGMAHDILVRQGLTVDATRLASMGITFDEERGYRVAEGDSAAGTQLANAPFFVDSTIAATPETQKRWRDLNRTLGTYTRKKNDPVASLAQGAALAKAMNAGAVAVLRASSWDVPIGKQFASMFGGAGNAQTSRSFLGITILADDGTILWDDWLLGSSLKPEALREQMGKLESNLP